MSIFTCMRKRKYSSETAAKSVIYKLRARNQDTEQLAPYRCQICGAWHLGRAAPHRVADWKKERAEA